jgi:predicted O-methyltransferase YrrM
MARKVQIKFKKFRVAARSIASQPRSVHAEEHIGANWHESFITHLASVVRPKVYVELGLYHCTLFNQIIPYAQQLIGVDVSEEPDKYMQKTSKTVFVNMSTYAFAEELRTHPIQIDMLFIDADHSREAVLNDFRNFFPFVAPHGLILLHDSHPKDEEQTKIGYCGTCYQAVAELSQHTEEYEMVTIPIPPGLTICRKRKEQLRWKENHTSSTVICKTEK